ncbi:MAG: efflux transporter outer membrane subunit [Bryobacteraceae bacterium]|jgi:NodT family efflux transporter outer membrane factor (OMF) lipoprotein
MNDLVHLRRPAMVLGTAGLLLLSTACMIGPKYRRPDAAAPPAFKEELPDGWKQAQPADGALRGKWWMVYDDPGLDALEEQVRISNQNVLAADAQFREARAAVRVARADLFPTVTTAPSATRSGSGAASGMGRFYSIPVDLIYQVDVWGSIRRGVAASSATAQASAAQLENATLLYQAELAADYFQIQGSDATRQLLDATVKSYEQSVQLTQNRYDGGVASLGDVALAQTQLETARAQLVDLGIQRAQFEHAIAVLTGKPPSDLSIPAAPNQSPAPLFPIGLPSTLLERRPDIAAAERQVAAANEEIGIAKAALYPSLTFGASAGSQATAIVDLLTWPSRFWSVGPQLAATLFDAGKRRAQVRLTQASYDATVANYRQTVLTSFQQVEDSMAQLRILSQEAEIVDRAVKFAQQSLAISTDQYRGGLTSYLQVTTAQTNTLQNQRAAVDILTRRKVASVSLIQALGGGWNASRMPSSRDLRR